MSEGRTEGLNDRIEKALSKETKIQGYFAKELAEIAKNSHERIHEDYIVPHRVYWVALESLNDVLAGSYLSMVLFGLGTSFLGAFLASSDEKQEITFGLVGLMLLILSIVLQMVFVIQKLRKMRRKAIKRHESFT